MNDPVMVIQKVMFPALWESLYMTFWGTVFSCILGFGFAVVLVITAEDGLTPHKYFYRLLNIAVNILRSFPFLILAVTILPITRAVMGTTIGKNAALFPLVIVACPFVARVFEGNLKAVTPGMIEAAKAFGASNWYIIFNVMLKEAIPSMCISVTLVVISILGSSSMAGALGAGGLGNVALIYGYQSFNDIIMYGTVLILVILVQSIQSIGNLLYSKLK